MIIEKPSMWKRGPRIVNNCKSLLEPGQSTIFIDQLYDPTQVLILQSIFDALAPALFKVGKHIAPQFGTHLPRPQEYISVARVQ